MRVADDQFAFTTAASGGGSEGIFRRMAAVPIGSIVVPLWDYLIGSKYEPQNGTSVEPMGRDRTQRTEEALKGTLYGYMEPRTLMVPL